MDNDTQHGVKGEREMILPESYAATLTQYVEDQHPELDEVLVFVVARKGSMIQPQAHIRQVGQEHEEVVATQPFKRIYDVLSDAMSFALQSLGQEALERARQMAGSDAEA